MATTMILQIFWSVTLILSQVVIRIGCVSCDRPRKIIKMAEKEKKIVEMLDCLVNPGIVSEMEGMTRKSIKKDSGKLNKYVIQMGFQLIFMNRQDSCLKKWLQNLPPFHPRRPSLNVRRATQTTQRPNSINMFVPMMRRGIPFLT